MTQRLTEGDTLDQLQTPEQVALLDTIDELRSQGLGHHGINLPQLIVCGDQSSGKSSLLEGLTRLRFPVKDNLGTTFATEVVLRRATSTRITCTITPCEKRTQADCRALSEFEHTFLSRDEFKFESVVDEAKELMANGVEDKRTSIFKDVLRIKYTGPSLPSLTVVDLPGMIEQDLGGSDADERIVELVTTYMRNKESIILAVVQAGNDPENQKVFKHLKKYDEKRLRTLGIITKPDRVYQGSESEKKLIALAKNEIYPLTHGWHAVRNRDHTTKDQSDIERDATEQQFFADGLWSSLPRKHVGIEALRAKLSRILLEHVSMGLDSIISAVHGAITTTESTLKSMGRARETTKEQRAYLTARAERFQMLTNDALRGIYSNTFFALLSPTERTPTRLRTTIQNLNIAFAHAMYRKGHTWDIISGQVPASGFTKVLGTSSSGTQEYETRFEDPMCISRTDFLENHIGAYVKQSRSSGLPSLVNPWVIGAVFRQQSENWCDIAKHHLQQVSRAVRDYIEEALGSLIDSRTHKLLMLKHIQPELEGRWRKVEAKLEELLVPYTEQDPITYDPGFIRDLEAMRTSRYKPNTDLQTQGIQFFGHAKSATVSSVTSQRLLTESLDDFTNSEILDLMQTYYKSAISVFINNIAVLAIENCLLKNLSAIFSPTMTADMDDEQLHAIAAESEDAREERLLLKSKLDALKSGKQILYEHIAMRPSVQVKISTQDVPQIAKNTPPYTPNPQRTDQSNDNVERARQGTMADLAANLNNLVVTPPPSGTNSRAASRRRVDSVNGKPSLDGGARKRSPLPRPPQFAIPGPEMQDGSEEEL